MEPIARRLWINLFALFLLFALVAGCLNASAKDGASPEVSSPAPLATPSLALSPQPDASLAPSRVPSTTTPPVPRVTPEQTPSSSLAPLTRSAMASCPVSLPNRKSPEAAPDFNYGNEDGTLFTIPWPGGIVIFSPQGPGFKASDGSLEMKWPWFRTIKGEVIITGRRLDAPAPPMPTQILRGIPDGYGETGFHPSGLVFPGEGCWEVTARVGDESLTFVTLVLKIPFEPAWPGWLPEGLALTDRDIRGLPESIASIFTPEDGGKGEVSIQTSQGIQEERASYPDSARQTVMVNGQPGLCVQGTMDEQGQWQAKADAGFLEWASGDLSNRVSQDGLGLHCEDLLRIAEPVP